jgi:hypothetical protein
MELFVPSPLQATTEEERKQTIDVIVSRPPGGRLSEGVVNGLPGTSFERIVPASLTRAISNMKKILGATSSNAPHPNCASHLLSLVGYTNFRVMLSEQRHRPAIDDLADCPVRF